MSGSRCTVEFRVCLLFKAKYRFGKHKVVLSLQSDSRNEITNYIELQNYQKLSVFMRALCIAP